MSGIARHLGPRVILHSDLNSFYANVECLHRPEIRDKPVVVGGHEELRHGIVLTKNRIAKSYGIKTAEALWEARQKCPGLVVVHPDYPLYLKFSRLAREIYYDYTDLVEPFGPDEAWLDITGSMHLWGNSPTLVAEEISERIKSELGLTVSIGVSWNKIFAKFGSDYKKPDAITYITPGNYRELVWPAPVEELLYVGRATKRKLNEAGIFTIGELATEASEAMMRNRFGVIGETLLAFARGEDTTPVKRYDPKNARVEVPIKSVGNGLTAPRDILSTDDAKMLLYMLSESVAQRLREIGMRATTIGIQVRNAELAGYSRQAPLPLPSNITSEIARSAFALLAENEPLDGAHPLRSMSVRASNLVSDTLPVQPDLFTNQAERERRQRLDRAVDDLRRRFGNLSVRRGVELGDELFATVDIKKENVVHPVGFFNG